jgi:hypothetical protein
MHRKFTIRAPALCRAALAASLLTLACPAAAQAHGIAGGATLPIPAWLFTWAAAVVLAVSFFGLAALWPTPRLGLTKQRRVGHLPRWVDVLGGAFGVALFAGIVYAGLAGVQEPTTNIVPTFVFVAFWVGVPVTSVLFGNWFSVVNPWRATARAVSWLGGRLAPKARRTGARAYPQRLGYWPAVAGLVCFGWLELVYVDRDQPSVLAVLALGYAAVQFLGMALYGIETWTRRGDAFAVYFSLLARLSPFTLRDRALYLRMPLSGLPSFELLPGSIALLCVMLGTTTFDGLSVGAAWAAVLPGLQRDFGHLGFGLEAASEAASTVGLLFSVLFVAGLYMLCVRGMRSVAPESHRTGELGASFAHTLVPVAIGYVIAHYFALLLSGSQSLSFLVSDPLGHGANLLGTANWTVNFALLSATAIWCVQVAVLVAGHIGGLVLAHERALVVFPTKDEAVRSQYWALCVMIGFTSLGLWLLSTVNV